MRKYLLIQSEIKHIARAMSWYRFSRGLIGVFIPLVFIQNGGSLLAVAGFFLLFSLFKLIADVPAMIMIQRQGVHFGLAISFVFYALHLVCVLAYVNTHNLAFLAFGGICLALIDCFGDNARHMYVSATMEDNSKSSSMATMEIFGQIADLAGPLIGALIGILLGGDWLLIIALLCLGFTFRPLATIRKLPILDKNAKLRFTLKNAPLRDNVANASFGSEETISLTLWPMYLAVALGTFSEIGVVTAISVIGTVFAVWLAGHRGDRGQTRTVLKQGIAGMSIVNGLRLTTTAFGPLALLGLGYRVAQGYGINALNATYYSHAKDRGLPYIVSIEIASDIGYLTTWSILFAVLAIFESSTALFATGFIMAAIVVWGALSFTPYKIKRPTAPHNV